MNLVDLFERRQQRVVTMYHGTTSKNLREILKHGLRANPPKRVYDQGDMKTAGGVYLTRNMELAIDYADHASDEFGGQPILITIQYTKDSGHVDEDILMQQIANAFTYITKANKRNEDEIADIIYQYITNKKYFKISDDDKLLMREYADVIANAGGRNVYTIHRYADIVDMRDKVLRRIKPAQEASEIFVDRDIKFSGKTRIKKITNVNTSEIIYPKDKKIEKFIIAYDFDNEMTYAFDVTENIDVERFIQSFERSTNIKIDEYRTVYAYDKSTINKLMKADTDIDTDDFEIIGNRIKLK